MVIFCLLYIYICAIINYRKTCDTQDGYLHAAKSRSTGTLKLRHHQPSTQIPGINFLNLSIGSRILLQMRYKGLEV